MKRSMELEIEINKLRAQALADDASLETIAEIRSAVDLATQKAYRCPGSRGRRAGRRPRPK